MDREDGAKYLKKRYEKADWPFLEALCDISPAELLRTAGKREVPFLIALEAPDTLFRKFFRSVDPSLRDRVGNTLLHYALAHDLHFGGTARRTFMLERGCDPDAANGAGFSVRDLRKHVEAMENTNGKRQNWQIK